MRALKKYEKMGLCGRREGHRRLVENYLSRSRHNLFISRTLWELGKNDRVKKILKLPHDFETSDWVVISSYYAMYHAALASLAAIDYKTDNHTATIIALEEFFVKKGLLELKFVHKLKEAKDRMEDIKPLERKYLRKIRRARRERETAQYTVTKLMGEEIAKRTLVDAPKFIDRMEILIDEIKTLEKKMNAKKSKWN